MAKTETFFSNISPNSDVIKSVKNIVQTRFIAGLIWMYSLNYIGTVARNTINRKLTAMAVLYTNPFNFLSFKPTASLAGFQLQVYF